MLNLYKINVKYNEVIDFAERIGRKGVIDLVFRITFFRFTPSETEINRNIEKPSFETRLIGKNKTKLC